MIDIKYLKKNELDNFLTSLKKSTVHSTAILKNVWKHRIPTFDCMQGIPPSLIDILREKCYIRNATIETHLSAFDKTEKIAVRFDDGSLVESVLIPSDKRLTACLSSQVGCAVGCSFCSTASMGFGRNIDYVEICNQLLLLNEIALSKHGKLIDSVVMMGMGEPFLNIENVFQSIRIMSASWGSGISPNKITISTSGIIPGIIQLADSDISCNLAVSLHSANNDCRNSIMRVNSIYNLSELKKALQYYYYQKKKSVTFEYLLLKEINDSMSDADQLIDYIRDIPCKVNIINFNETQKTSYRQTGHDQKTTFISRLHNAGIVVMERKSKGEEIAAACGQLIIK